MIGVSGCSLASLQIGPPKTLQRSPSACTEIPLAFLKRGIGAQAEWIGAVQHFMDSEAALPALAHKTLVYWEEVLMITY